MSQDQFSSASVCNLITLTGQTSTFNPVSFEGSLKSLSKYSIVSGDIRPDLITKELSDIFKFEQIGCKSYIKFDEIYY